MKITFYREDTATEILLILEEERRKINRERGKTSKGKQE